MAQLRAREDAGWPSEGQPFGCPPTDVECMSTKLGREDAGWPTEGQPLGCPPTDVECMSTKVGGWEMDCD